MRFSSVLTGTLVALLTLLALVGGCGGGTAGGAGAPQGQDSSASGTLSVRLDLPAAALAVQVSPSPSPAITHVIVDVLDAATGTRVVSPTRVDVAQDQPTRVSLRVSPGFRQVAADFRGVSGSLGTDAENVEIVAGRAVSVDLSPGSPSPSPSPSPPPPGGRVYIPNNVAAGTLTVLDALTFAPVAGSPAAVSPNPNGVAVDPTRGRLWVSCDTEVSVLDETTLAHVAGSPIADGGSFQVDVVYVAQHDRVYVTDLFNFKLRAFDPATLVQTLLVACQRPAELVYDVTGDRLWVANNTGAGTVEVFDPATLAQVVGSPLAAGGSPDGAAYDPLHERVYITNSTSDSLAVYDTATLAQIPGSPFPTGNFPVAVSYDHVRDRVYVTNLSNSTVSVYDGATMGEIPGSPFPTGAGPISVLADSARDRVYVVNQSDGTLTVFDAATMVEVAGSPFAAGASPTGIAVDP